MMNEFDIYKYDVLLKCVCQPCTSALLAHFVLYVYLSQTALFLYCLALNMSA